MHGRTPVVLAAVVIDVPRGYVPLGGQIRVRSFSTEPLLGAAGQIGDPASAPPQAPHQRSRRRRRIKTVHCLVEVVAQPGQPQWFQPSTVARLPHPHSKRLRRALDSSTGVIAPPH